jgi:hypothetical protein
MDVVDGNEGRKIVLPPVGELRVTVGASAKAGADAASMSDTPTATARPATPKVF